MISAKSAAALVLACALTAGAGAAPITFQFNMPAFNRGDFAGQTSTLWVTADNGGSSAINQVFLNTDIFGLEAHVGNMSISLFSPPALRLTLDSIPYITTNSSGEALLDLSARLDSYVSIGTLFAPGGLQLATDDGRTGVVYYPYAVVISGQGTGSIDPIIGPPIVVRGTQVAPVPEPGSLALLTIGMLGVVGSRRYVLTRGSLSTAAARSAL